MAAKELKGWVPDAKARKLLAMYNARLTVYADGVVLSEPRDVDLGEGLSKTVYINHIYPADIRFGSQHERSEGETELKAKRVEIQPAQLAMHGIESVRVYYNYEIPELTAKELFLTQIVWKDPDGGRSESFQMTGLRGDVKVAPNMPRVSRYDSKEPETSVRAWLNGGARWVYDELVLVHGELPELVAA